VGLHYNYFRDYEPGTGRYVESDPIGLDGGISTFAYVSGRPIISIDKFGLYGNNAAMHFWLNTYVPPPPPPDCRNCDYLCEVSATNCRRIAGYGAGLIGAAMIAPEPMGTKLCGAFLMAAALVIGIEGPERCGPGGESLQGGLQVVQVSAAHRAIKRIRVFSAGLVSGVGAQVLICLPERDQPLEMHSWWDGLCTLDDSRAIRHEDLRSRCRLFSRSAGRARWCFHLDLRRK
jgi:hypothetical protein